MSLLGRIFGKKSSQVNVQDDSDKSNSIRVFDEFGREYFISKEQWRKDVLPGNIKNNWDNPDTLYTIIVGSLRDGFAADVLEASEQLYRIDKNFTRSACIRSIVLTQNGRLDEAEQVLQSHLKENGEEGVVLTNLAKVYAERGQHEKVNDILWHALEVDPNQDNGVEWFAALANDRGGEDAYIDALRRVSALKGSYRSQLWLARNALDKKDKDAALRYYAESLANAPALKPADLLMRMSGDLGNHGYLAEIVSLTDPHFDPKVHGLQVGNNLIKAHLELGQVQAAQGIKEQLYAQNRLDWNETLSYWDTEIAKAKLKDIPTEQAEPLEMIILQIDAPVWLPSQSPMNTLFPIKPEDAPSVSFLGSSAETESKPDHVTQQLADAPGRMSRALPLFLAELITYKTEARTNVLIPWMAKDGAGFILAGEAWSDEKALAYVQEENKTDYLVTIHLKCQSTPWQVEARLIRISDGVCLRELSGGIDIDAPFADVTTLATQLLTSLHKDAHIALSAGSDLYKVPNGAQFSYYLLRLEQLLAVRCAANNLSTSSFLSGERAIIDGNLQLCLEFPANAVTRILLAQTLTSMKQMRPEVLVEFKDRVKLLEEKWPLQGIAGETVRRVINDALET